MALTCPRCGTDVPNEALYCPYCSLPKPKHGFAAAEEDIPKEINVAEKTNVATVATRKAPVAPSSEKKSPKRQAKRSTMGPAKPPRKLRLSVLSVAALVAVFSAGVYIFVVPMVYSGQPEPKTVLSALDKLRHMPSSDPEVTVDARLLREMETSRRVGNLKAYQGWTVHHIKGNKTKVLLTFSFEEVGGARQSAEWMADLNNNTFTPESALARAVYEKQ